MLCFVGKKMALRPSVDIASGPRGVSVGSLRGKFDFTSDCGAAARAAAREKDNSSGAAGRGQE